MSARNSRRQLVRLRIVVDGGDEPTWREITIDGSLRLAELADAIIIAFGWTGLGTGRFGRANAGWNSGSIGYGRGLDSSYETGSYGPPTVRPESLSPLPPLRPVPREWKLHDHYDGDEELTPYLRQFEWTIDAALEKIGFSLRYEYECAFREPHAWRRDALAPLDQLHDADDDPGGTHRSLFDLHRMHRIELVEHLDAQATDAVVRYMGGGGLVDRTIGEAHFGELGDPTWTEAINAELDLRFAQDAETSRRNRTEPIGFSPRVHSALAGAGLPARRALRLDAVRAGLFHPVDVHEHDVDEVTAAIRETLARASRAPGIPRDTADELAHDLKHLGFLRTVNGHLVTKAAARRYLDGSLPLWIELARRLMASESPTRYGSLRTPHDLVQFAIDLARDGLPIRTIALAERFDPFCEQPDEPAPTATLSDAAQRARRVLNRAGLIDALGQPCHRATVAFARTMLVC